MNKQELINSIAEKEIKLSKLALVVDKSETCSSIYNHLVVEKAVLKKELDNLKNKNKKILGKIKRFLPFKKSLICDYFKTEV